MAKTRRLQQAVDVSGLAAAARRDLADTRVYAEVAQGYRGALTQELRGSGFGRQIFPAARVAVTGAAGGMLGGFLAGGPGAVAGGALGAVAGAFLRPASSIGRIANLSQVFQRQGSALLAAKKGLAAALGTSGRLLGRVSRPAAVLSAFQSWTSYKDLQEQYNDVKAELDDLRNAGAIQARLEMQSKGLAQLDPDLVMHFQNTQMRAMEYLDLNMPRTTEDPMGFRAPTPPSASAMSAFVARYRALDNPVSLMWDFAEGRVRSEAVEAVSYVYPELYQEMGKLVADAIIQRRGNVPYQARVQAALYFQVPDQTMSPSFLTAMGSTYHQTEQQTRAVQAIARRNDTLLSRQSRTMSDRFQE